MAHFCRHRWGAPVSWRHFARLFVSVEANPPPPLRNHRSHIRCTARSRTPVRGRRDHSKKWHRRYSYIDFLRYAWGALMISQFRGRSGPDGRPVTINGEPILSYYGLEDYTAWEMLGYEVLFFIVFFAAAWAALQFSALRPGPSILRPRRSRPAVRTPALPGVDFRSDPAPSVCRRCFARGRFARQQQLSSCVLLLPVSVSAGKPRSSRHPGTWRCAPKASLDTSFRTMGTGDCPWASVRKRDFAAHLVCHNTDGCCVRLQSACPSADERASDDSIPRTRPTRSRRRWPGASRIRHPISLHCSSALHCRASALERKTPPAARQDRIVLPGKSGLCTSMDLWVPALDLWQKVKEHTCAEKKMVVDFMVGCVDH